MTDVCDPALFGGGPGRFGHVPGGNVLHSSEPSDENRWSSWPKLELGAAAGRVVATQVTFRDYGEAPPPRRNRGQMDGGAVARGMDVVLAALLIVFLFPVLLGVAVLVYCSDPGPIVFAHRRQGRNGKAFGCLKFRSMVADADRQLQILLARDAEAREEWERDHKLRNDPRITRVGGFLRKSSLDELPQLFNVLRGDMSLVGPRPIVEAEVSRYGRYISHYYQIRPGITGLWQISGRNDTTYRRRVALDVIYSRRKSASLNLRILVMTLPSVLKSRGAF